MESPHMFVIACDFYYSTLLKLRLFDEADALFARISGLVGVKREGSRAPIVPQLPYSFVCRYLAFACREADLLLEDHEERLLKAWKLLIKNLQDTSVMDQLQKGGRWISFDRELDKQLVPALIALEKVSLEMGKGDRCRL
jgi:hypothetical protein